MSSREALIATSLSQNLDFNWIFLVELIVCVILTLFFLFYFNRLFARLVSYGIRAWTWHKYRVYFDVQALQISLLGGRIFFKGLKYHGNNETVLVHSGFVTWTYWLRNVREVDLGLGRDVHHLSKQSTCDDNSTAPDPAVAENRGKPDRETLPCRLTLELKGLEWFIYNRSPAYDSIIAGLSGESQPAGDDERDGGVDVKGSDAGLRRRGFGDAFGNQANLARSTTATTSESDKQSAPVTEKDTYRASTLTSDDSSDGGDQSDEDASVVEQSLWLQFLPMHIECTKAAIVLGNENTKSVFITKADKFSGEIDATGSRPPDLYKQFFNFKLEHPVIQFKPNEDYKEDQMVAATHVDSKPKDDASADAVHHRRRFFPRFRREVLHRLRDLVPYFSSSVETFSSMSSTDQGRSQQSWHENSRNWQGLSRYLNDDEADSKAKWSSFEYATVTTILDSPEASISYYWDIPGKVPRASPLSKPTSCQSTDINGNRLPEWGIDVVVKGAVINYGPWADRQRADLQRVFFPSLCKDAVPVKKLSPGELRIATVLKIYIQLDDDTTLRVPIREESKNWKWKAQADTMTARTNAQNERHERGFRRHKVKPAGPEIRPFGWLDLKLSSNATISYAMDMVAGKTGFSNTLSLELPNLEITTSVNHGLLWRSLNLRLSCNLSNPLGWNALHTWSFDFVCKGTELFILREHVFLLIDLVDDWTSGPAADYLTFVPFKYLLNVRFDDFKLYLNVNDSNIINNPSDMDDNTFLIIFGTALTADLCIPLDRYRPHKNEVTFDVTAHSGGLDLHVPPWNTQATFLSSTELAQLQGLTINGKYQYCDTTSTSNTDTVLLDVSGKNLEVQLYGFFIRYLMKIKDNYFGEDLHFKTLEEYQQTANAADPTEFARLSKPPYKKSNDLDVIFSINADDIGALLPANLYSAAKHVRIDIATLSANLRFTNYYMDLNVSLSPLAFSPGKLEELLSTASSTSSTQVYVDGVEIFGNRLFGLPPTEPTYLCNWDFDVGAVTGETSGQFVSELACAVKAFAFSFDDDENALPVVNPVLLHDVTFLRAFIKRIHIWIHVEDVAFLASTGGIDINFNDWAGALYSKKLKVSVPDLVIACADTDSVSRHKSRTNNLAETHAYVATTIELTMVNRKAGFEQEKGLQQRHIRHEDSRTHRTPFFLFDGLQEIPSESSDPPAMWIPPVPIPLFRTQKHPWDETSSFMSSTQSSRQSIRRKSSFLATSVSSKSSRESIIRTRSSFSAHRPHHGNQANGSPLRSRHLGSNLHLTSRARDISQTSTGRQASFHSAVDHIDAGICQSSGFIHSSPFMEPHFPLGCVYPDTKDVPDLEDFDVTEHMHMPHQELSEIAPRFEDSNEYTSFIIELSQGVRAYCNPEALKAVANFLETMQSATPDDILDDLQIEAVQRVFAKRQSVVAKSVDLNLVVPVIRLRFGSAHLTEQEYQVNQPLDQYDFAVDGLSVVLRQGSAVKQDTKSEMPAHSLALHVRLQSIEVSAKERLHELDNAQAAIHARVEDVLFWTVTSDTVSGSLNVGAVDVALASSKVEYLASLLHRTTHLTYERGESFAALTRQQSDRIRVFAYLLATSGHHTADPQFLTRPSYVLRSASGHLRVTDSWKAITRLRHVYYSLGGNEKNTIRQRLRSNCFMCPSNIREQVEAEFESWRSWDLVNLTECELMKSIFGSTADCAASQTEFNRAVRLAFAIKNTNLVLDPGPKQNEIVLATLLANATVSTRNLDADGYLSVKSTILQVYCADVSLSLNWEICELAENILKLYNGTKSSTISMPKPSAKATPSKLTKPKHENRFHVIVATENGSITLDTINIHTISLSKGLKASFVFVNEEYNGNSIMTALITSDAATTKVRSHQQEVSLYQIRHPTVNISYEKQFNLSSQENVWKIAGNAQQISFVVKQEAIVLLEILERVVGDEVVQIRNILQNLPGQSPQHSPKSAAAPGVVTNKINIALFLDTYYISLPLLPSLRYDISGVIARASLSARQDAEYVFDFDIKENSHDIQIQHSGKHRKISVLQFPPTNGRIIAQRNSEEDKISAFVSVEPIHLDAAAIQSVLSAVNRPEITSVLDELRGSLHSVKSRFQETFHPGVTITPLEGQISNSEKQFIYDAHLSLAGLEVSTDAPNGDSGNDKARLSFNLGSVQIEAFNRLESHGAALTYPELQLNLRRVVFDLASIDDNGTETTCGNFAFAAYFTAGSKRTENNDLVRSYHITSSHLDINLYTDTAATIVNVVAHLQNKIKELDLTREVQYLQRLRTPKLAPKDEDVPTPGSKVPSVNLFDSMFSLELSNVQISWIVIGTEMENKHGRENLMFSLERIGLSTRKKNSARLTIESLMLQMVQPGHNSKDRAHNSAVLPEIIFNVGFISTSRTTRLAFQAAGKTLDLRLTSQFIIPGSYIQKSIESAVDKVRAASASWMTSPASEKPSQTTKNMFFGKKRMESLLVDADFAGAIVHLHGIKPSNSPSTGGIDRRGRLPQVGRYGQFSQEDPGSSTILRSPGLAIKVEYKDNDVDDPSLNAEIKIEKSENILYPQVVPLIMEITSNIQTVMRTGPQADSNLLQKVSSQKIRSVTDDNILIADPSAMLGRTKLNVGIRICAQEFTLSCQPIARVSATAQFDDIYTTISTVRSADHGHFFAISAVAKDLRASVQHVYSREATGEFKVNTIVLSLMNSKHLSGISGMSAILKIAPTKVLINAKQLQDFLLFRDIWLPTEVRQSALPVAQPSATSHSQAYLVQRYQQVAATAAFPWNATISIEELDVQLELGQAIGKSKFIISKFWVSSKKNSDWEQNLCLGFEKVGIDSTGRMSGSASLQDFQIRTSIQWPEREKAINQTPLVQGAISFSQFRLKIAFDYQAFLVADVTSFKFLLYNVRHDRSAKGDRLVSLLDGDSVQIFCTTTTASQALALYQAFGKLVQEKRTNYEASLKEVERFLRRRSSIASVPSAGNEVISPGGEELAKAPVTLHTDLVVTLRAVNMGVYPSTFFDLQIFKIEAHNAQFRFAVTVVNSRVHSKLGLTLGELRIGLAATKTTEHAKVRGEIAVDEVVSNATGSRGGTILKVPKVEAAMETWQSTGSRHIDYIFKSSFEGKVEVGWNYSRISYIRSMYNNHAKSLAQQLGKPLPPSAVKITGVPDADDEGGEGKLHEQQKITAEVTVPQSKYEYTALEPAVIQTPQLRDMGEATPPLEWIGLHRDRLPTLTHQIVIVTLLELASEVEDAYAKILGTS